MNYNKIIKNTLPTVLIAGFIILKISDLFLPYFWDEAWSYFPAIKAMATEAPSLFPNSISPELYKGHPLMFYFLSSTWLKLLGSTIWVTKLFALLVSIALLIATYSFSKKHFDYQTAVLSIFILMIQSVFFAQATFLLPEILITLFTILSLHTYLSKKYIQTSIWLCLALLTKESGIAIWCTIVIFECIKSIKDHCCPVNRKFNNIS